MVVGRGVGGRVVAGVVEVTVAVFYGSKHKTIDTGGQRTTTRLWLRSHKGLLPRRFVITSSPRKRRTRSEVPALRPPPLYATRGEYARSHWEDFAFFCTSLLLHALSTSSRTADRPHVPDMLSCSWELLLWHSLSSVKSSLPSMFIVCRGPVMPAVWNGPGDTWEANGESDRQLPLTSPIHMAPGLLSVQAVY